MGPEIAGRQQAERGRQEHRQPRRPADGQPPTTELDGDAFLQHGALAILLQHPSLISHPDIICRLLTLSHATAAVVTASCSKQMSISLARTCPRSRDAAETVAQSAALQQLGAWFCRNSGLVKQLQLTLPFDADSLEQQQQLLQQLRQHAPAITHLNIVDTGDFRDVDEAIAALQVAARFAAPHLTNLESLSCTHIRSSIIKRLPPSSLTVLKVHEYVPPQHLGGVGWLTQLQELQLSTSLNDGRFGLLGEFRALTKLKRLRLHAETTRPDIVLKHLPPQLVDLELHDGNYDDFFFEQHFDEPQQQFFSLQHLTALTRMEHGLTDLCRVPDALVQLPPNLVRLSLCQVRHVQPLLALSRLRHLQIDACSTQASELLRLNDTALSELTHLGLQFSTDPPDSREVLAPAVPLLSRLTALRKLAVAGEEMDFDAEEDENAAGAPEFVPVVLRLMPDMLRQLAQLTGLTALELSEVAVAAHNKQALQGMFSAVQELQLDGVRYINPEAPAVLWLHEVGTESDSDSEWEG